MTRTGARVWLIAFLFMASAAGIVAALVGTPAPGAPAPAPPPPPPPPLAPQPFAPHEGSELQHRRLEVTDLVAMFPDRVVRSGPADRRAVALTFDDGPDAAFTPRILDALRVEGVRATFFVTGIQAERHPDVLKRLVREGHAVASHGYGHIRYSAVPPEVVRADLRRNAGLIRRLTGRNPTLFRPPYGALDRLAAQLVIDEGYRIVLWSIDTRDWLGRPPEQIARAVLEGAGNGSIILQHAASGPEVDLGGTIAALPRIIRGLKAKGLSFVTVPELLR